MSVEIKLIGVNHFDPFGRDRIAEYLTKEKEVGFIPDCLAVEWDSSIFRRIYEQRDYLYQKLLMKEYTSNIVEAKMLADSMGFEADSHYSVYNNVPILWLDEGREASEEEISAFADDRYEILLKYRCVRDNSFDMESTRRLLLHKKDFIDYEPSERDNVFFLKTMKAVDSGKSRIVCIVGQNHTRIDIEGSFGYQIKEAGFSFSTIDTTSY